MTTKSPETCGSDVMCSDLLCELVRALEAAQFANTCCDKREDRMWHAADNTWWRRVGNRWLSAEPPPGYSSHGVGGKCEACEALKEWDEHQQR